MPCTMYKKCLWIGLLSCVYAAGSQAHNLTQPSPQVSSHPTEITTPSLKQDIVNHPILWTLSPILESILVVGVSISLLVNTWNWEEKNLLTLFVGALLSTLLNALLASGLAGWKSRWTMVCSTLFLRLGLNGDLKHIVPDNDIFRLLVGLGLYPCCVAFLALLACRLYDHYMGTSDAHKEASKQVVSAA